MLYVVRDWLPFTLLLVAYDLSRGAAELVGRPTMWHWQADVDRRMFFGTMPTVWLQERIKLANPPWWEVVLQHRLHVVFRPAVRGGGRALATEPGGVESVRQLFVVLSWPRW